MSSRGIIYEYEDGGKYCGEWESDAAHGHGVCTGPKGNGLFEGLWQKGNQTSGVFTWPNGQKYTGKWQDGLREGLGRETKQDGTEYSGDFTKDSRGPYGVLRQPNGVVYRGMWHRGIQNGEGTEIYVDGGMYRGEYHNGFRHGHGTRSSANYEQSNDQPALSSLPSSSSMTSCSSSETLATALEDPSSHSMGSGLASSDKTDFQVYEGQWKDDKRHGYGVLKILNQYTYYGQWEENMRSGYGVMIYDDKRKEEGQWQRGKLVVPLKKRKLQLKMRQLESKVNEAHTNALQAADGARRKADLAEGRANTATAKARQAARVVQQALKDAEIARMNEKMYKNAPKVQESIKSPVTDINVEFPAIDPLFSKEGGASTDSSSYLSVGRQMAPTPSLENVAGLRDYPDVSRSFSKDSNESDEGFNDEEEKTASESQDSLASTSSASLKREKYHASWQLSIAKRRESDDQLEKSRADAPMSRGVGAKKRLIDIKGASDSDTNLISRRGQIRPQSGSRPHSLSTSYLLSGEGEEAVRKRPVYKATGEPDPGDNTDEEELLVERKSRLSLPKPLTKPSSVSMDMLQQMAKWNKMVAYINFALLFFLLFLIIIVMIVLNYYYLVHQLSTSHPQSPPSFMSGPMA